MSLVPCGYETGLANFCQGFSPAFARVLRRGKPQQESKNRALSHSFWHSAVLCAREWGPLAKGPAARLVDAGTDGLAPAFALLRRGKQGDGEDDALSGGKISAD